MKRDIMIIGETNIASDGSNDGVFGGTNGWMLNQLLSAVGIAKRDVYATVVFHQNKGLYHFLGDKTTAIAGKPAIDKKYVRKEFEHELRRLDAEIANTKPAVIITLGHVAAWAVLNTVGIRAIRGATTCTDNGVKVVPTYHPSQVLKDWSLRPIVMSDLNKAKYESGFHELRRPVREVWIEPDLKDLEDYERDFILPAERLSVDIETKGDQITCIGFAPSTSSALVIPFYADGRAGQNYWPDTASELKAWDYVRRWCTTKPSVFQNGLYDMHFLWRRYGIPCLPQQHDTMLLHHAMQMEMEKGLGFLATLYTHEASWKHMRKSDTIKKAD